VFKVWFLKVKMMFCFSKSIFFIKGTLQKKVLILLKFKKINLCEFQLLEKCGFTPDSSRIVRYFMNGDPRTQNAEPYND
jgi:hypothetical protein